MLTVIVLCICAEIVLMFVKAPWAARAKQTLDAAFPYLALMVLAVWLNGTWLGVLLALVVVILADQRSRVWLRAWVLAGVARFAR